MNLVHPGRGPGNEATFDNREAKKDGLLLGECSALWGKRERVVWCIIVFIALLAYISHNNSLISRSSRLQL